MFLDLASSIGKDRTHLFRRLNLVVIVAISASSAFAQPAILESLRETIISRWDFQKQFPIAGKLFMSTTSEPERQDLIERLQVNHPQLITNPASPTFVDLWSDFTVGLALEKRKVGEGEANLVAVAQMARGNVVVNYELARILTMSGMYQRAKAFQLQAHRAMLERGYLRIPELSKLQLLHAREAINRSQFQMARQELDFASRLDPFCPWVSLFLMEMELREKSILHWNLGMIRARIAESLRMLRYYDTQSLFLINVSRTLRIGFGIFGAIVLLVLFARHFTRVTHLWAERFPKEVEMRVRYLALAILVVSLVLAGIGYAVFGLILVMLLWKHCAREEKSFLKILMMGMALIPFLLVWEQSMGRHLDENLGVNLYHRAYYRGFETPMVEKMNSFIPITQEDSLYEALALSVSYKKHGNYLKAGEYAQIASAFEASNPMVLLNNGNLAMVGFDYPVATSYYSKARKIAPDRLETWFNSSQAALYSNNSDQHKKYLDVAAETDSPWITQYLKDNDDYFPEYPPNRKAMDPVLQMTQAWAAAWSGLSGLEFLRVRMRVGIYEILGGWLLAAIGMVSLMLFLRFRQHTQHSHGKDLFDCKICGRVMCQVCRKGVHCQFCFKTVSGIQENKVKMEMVYRLRNRSALVMVRMGSILNSLWPGAGNIYLNRGTGRYLWPLLTGILIGGLWQTNHLLMEYPLYVLGPLRWVPWFPILILYGCFNLILLRATVDLTDVLQSSPSREKAGVR